MKSLKQVLNKFRKQKKEDEVQRQHDEEWLLTELTEAGLNFKVVDVAHIDGSDSIIDLGLIGIRCYPQSKFRILQKTGMNLFVPISMVESKKDLLYVIAKHII